MSLDSCLYGQEAPSFDSAVPACCTKEHNHAGLLDILGFGGDLELAYQFIIGSFGLKDLLLISDKLASLASRKLQTSMSSDCSCPQVLSNDQFSAFLCHYFHRPDYYAA